MSNFSFHIESDALCVSVVFKLIFLILTFVGICVKRESEIYLLKQSTIWIGGNFIANYLSIILTIILQTKLDLFFAFS